MTSKNTTATRPTDGELEILRVLWERGPSTVREVHESLGDIRRTGYTTVLKLLQIMRIHNVSIEYVKKTRERHGDVSVDELVSRRIRGSHYDD